MKFTPKSEEEIRAEQEKRGAWPPGVYDAEIATAVDSVSKAGNDMIELALNVYHPEDGAPRQMKDWLVEAMAFKVRHCANAAGLSAEYEKGELLAWQLEGKAVKVKLGTETYKAEDGGTRTRNKVQDYVVAPNAAPRPTSPARRMATASAKDDPFEDIPF